MGNPENRGGNALNNEGGRNDAFDVWSKALASKASWEERAKQIAKEVKGGVPSWKDNESDGIEWTDISVDKNIKKPDNTNDANLAGEPAKDEYVYHISPEDVRGVDPELVVDITGILNAKKINQNKDKGTEKGPDEGKSSEENTTEKNGNNKTDVDTKEDGVDSAKTPDDEEFTNKEEIEKEVTKNWNSLKRYEEASALNPENLEKKRGLVAGLLNKIKTTGVGKKVALVAITAVLSGMMFLSGVIPGANAKKGNIPLNNQTAIETTQNTLDVAEDNQDVLDETKAEKTNLIPEIKLAGGEVLQINGELGGDNLGTDYFSYAEKIEGRNKAFGPSLPEFRQNTYAWDAVANDHDARNDMTRRIIERHFQSALDTPQMFTMLAMMGEFNDGDKRVTQEKLNDLIHMAESDNAFYEEMVNVYKEKFPSYISDVYFNIAKSNDNYGSFYLDSEGGYEGANMLSVKYDSVVAPEVGGSLIIEWQTADGKNWFNEHPEALENLLSIAGIDGSGGSGGNAEDVTILGLGANCNGAQPHIKKTPHGSSTTTKKTPNKTPKDSSTHNNVTPTPDKEPVPVPTPEPEPQPQTPGENTVTPNDKPGDKPGNNPNDKPGDKPGENPGGKPGGKTVELKGKTDYVGVDFDQNDNEATGTETDQNRPVAIKDEGENNILENGAGDVEENGQAFAEQAGNEYVATIGDKSEDNQRTVEIGDVDTESRTTAEASQTFENDDHTVNEKADEDSNGLENFTYENLFN
jgi:putative cell surface-anchored protein